MGGAHPLRSGQEEPRPAQVEPTPSPSEVAGVPSAPVRLGQTRAPSGAPGLRAARINPRLVVVVALLLAGVVWAVIRGLHFYGLAPIKVAYDLDQPPLLLILVGGWLAYRSRRR